MSKSMCDAIVALTAALAEAHAKVEATSNSSGGLATEYASTVSEYAEHRAWASSRLDEAYEKIDSLRAELHGYEDRYLAKVEELRRVYHENNELRDKLTPPPSREVVEAKLVAYMANAAHTGALAKSKIGAIKDVRNLTGCGLKEAKDYVEAYIERQALNLSVPTWPSP